MDVPAYNNIVIKTLTEIDLLLHNFVYNGYTALSDYLRVPLGIITALYITIFGYAIMMGWVRVNLGNFVKVVLKIGGVYLAVTSWGWVSENVVGLVNGAIHGLGEALMSASPIHIPGVGGINMAMQTTLTQFSKLGSVVFSSGGLRNLGAWFDGLVIWTFGYLIVGLGLFEIIFAKVMLALLFVFTPVLVLLCYFKVFQQVFDRWLGSIVGFALLQLFVTGAMTLALSLAYWWVSLHVGETALEIGNYGTLPIVLIGIICIGLILKAAQLAQNLGGVVSSASASAMVGGMIGGTIGASMSALRLGRWMVGPTSALVGVRKTTDQATPAGTKSSMKSSMNESRSALRRGESK